MRTQPQEILRALAESDRFERAAILNQAQCDGLTEFIEGVRMALDPDNPLPPISAPRKTDSTGQGLPWPAFRAMALALAQGTLSAQEQHDIILTQMAIATQDQWNGYYRQILSRKFDCGLTWAEVQTVLV